MAKKLTQIAPRRWLGNGMGYDPAEYAVLNRFGERVARVQADLLHGWRVISLANEWNTREFRTFREARAYALEHFS